MLALVLLAMWPAFSIPFGIIDDHDIIDIIGPRQRLPLWQVPHELFVRTNEPLGRFRPVYWLGHVLECAVAGRDPVLWWVDRSVLATICVVAVFSALRLFLPVTWSVAVSFLVLCGAQFETFRRLGPNEAYAMPLACIAVALLVRGIRRGLPPGRLWPVYVCAVLAAGAKENFVPFAGLVVLASVCCTGLARMRRADWAVVLTTSTLLAADLAMILVKLAEHGSQYPQPRTPYTTVSWAVFADSTLDEGGRLNLCLALLVFVLILHRRRLDRGLAWWLTLVAANSLLQVLFYAGGPTAGRYLYPLALAAVVLWAAVVVLVRRLANPWARVVMLALIGVALGLSVVGGIWNARVTEAAVAQQNRHFSERLSGLERMIVRRNVNTVVLQPQEPLTDQERVFSLARYIHADIGVPVMTLPATQGSGAFSNSLGSTLEDWSREGSGRLVPYRPTSDCVSVVFGDAEPVCSLHVPAPG